MRLHVYGITLAWLIFTATSFLFGQSDDLTVHLAKYPQTITAFDVSDDGAWLAEGGGALLLVSNVIDESPVFSASIPYGVQIESLKISPDKTKLAVLSSDKLSKDRFVTLYDLQQQRLLMATVLTTLFIPPLDRLRELDPSEVRRQIENKAASLFMPALAERFKFTGDRLFLFFPQSVAEFYFDGEHKKSKLSYLKGKADFFQSAGFEKVKADTVPHDYTLMPWFCRFDSIMQRTYHKVIFDPAFTHGFVLYTHHGRLQSEVWNIEKGEKISDNAQTNLPLTELKDLDANLISLSPDGMSLFYYHVDSTDLSTLNIYGSVQRLDIAEKKVQTLFRFSEPEPVVNLKLSPDGAYLFCNGVDYDMSMLSNLLNLGSLQQNYAQQIVSNFWSYSMQTKQLIKLPVGHSAISNVVFSNGLNDAFVGTENNFFRINLRENIVYPMNSFVAPKIVKTEIDSAGYLWISTDKDIRKFDLTCMRQLDYWPMGKIERITFQPDHSIAYSTDGEMITATDLPSGRKKQTSPHKNTIGGLAYHVQTDKIISSEFIDMQTWSNSCRLLFGKMGSETEALPFSSSYSFIKVDSIVKRDKPALQKSTPAYQLVLSPDGNYLACAMQAKMPVDPMVLMKLIGESLRSQNDSDAVDKLEGALDVQDPYPGEIKLWKIEKGRWTEFKTLAIDKEYVNRNTGRNAFAFSNDSKYFAAADKDLTIHIWEVHTGRKIGDCIGGHGDNFTVDQLSWFRSEGKLDDFKTAYNISAVAFSPDNQYLVSAGNDRKLVIWKRIQTAAENMNAGRPAQSSAEHLSSNITYQYDTTVIGEFSASAVTTLTFSPDGRFLLIGAADGTVTLLNFAQKIVQGIVLLSNHSDGYIILGPYNRYYANPEGENLLYFTSSTNSYPAEQFDLYYNRPDFLTAFFGMLFLDTYQNDSSTLARMLYNVSADSATLNKRLSLYGLNVKSALHYSDNGLEVELLNQSALLKNQTVSSEAIDLDIQAKGTVSSLKAVHVWVNNVPFFGRGGKPVNSNLSTWNQKISVPLSDGENLIQIACSDVAGRYSLRKSLIVYHRANNRKAGLFLVVLGVDNFKSLDKLKYPVKNCRDIVTFFTKNSAGYAHVDSFFNERLTKESVANLKITLQKTHPDDKVIVFYSGHGRQTPDHNLFLGTVETRENDFAGTALPYSMLDDLLDSIPARQKLLLIDACESGLTDPTVLSTRKSDPGVAVFLETLEMFTDLNRGTGTVTIGSTTGYTKAVEWPKLGNSAFSYVLLQALRKPAGAKYSPGDYDQNNTVTVSELQRYLKHNVPELNRALIREVAIPASAIDQRPSSRTVNLRNDFRIF